MSFLSNDGSLRAALLVLALVIAGCDPPAAPPPSCTIVPPSGPFVATLRLGAAPPTLRELPANPGASSTLISPAPRHRWEPRGGLVETSDGSMLLHGVVRRVRGAAGPISIAVFADYAPVEASIRLWNAGRDEALQRAEGQSSFTAEFSGTDIAFDIELPARTVAVGRWREVQTVVSAGAEPDVRRWTLYAGPKPPEPLQCTVGDLDVSIKSGRSALADGVLRLRASQPTDVAVVAVTPDRGPPAFVRFPAAGGGWEAAVGSASSVWVWEAPMSGPGTSWISTFWSPTSHPDAAAARSVR